MKNKQKYFIKKISIFLTILALNFILVYPIFAQGDILPEASGPSRCAGLSATECGDYQVNDFVVLAANVARWILGIVGSLTLVMFVYGGILFLISAGSSDKVSQAKKIITAAVIGLVIVFGSYLIVKFALSTIGITWTGQML